MTINEPNTKMCVYSARTWHAKRQMPHALSRSQAACAAAAFSHQVLAEYTHIFVFGSFIVILLSFLTPN